MSGDDRGDRHGDSFSEPPSPWSLDAKRLILTVTAGRTGTGYIAHLLQGFPDLCCLHEPEPKFSSAMRSAQADPSIAIRFLRDEKLPAIRSYAAKTYFETSHLACKGFLEPLIDHGVPFDLVFVRRDRFSVATSLTQLGTVPGRTPLGLQFLLSPEDPGVLRIEPWRDLSDWGLCYWYCLEIERRMKVFGERLSEVGGASFTTSIAELQQPQHLGMFLAFLMPDHDVTTAMQMVESARGKVVNHKTELKNRIGGASMTTEEMLEAAHEVDLRVRRSNQ